MTGEERIGWKRREKAGEVGKNEITTYNSALFAVFRISVIILRQWGGGGGGEIIMGRCRGRRIGGG